MDYQLRWLIRRDMPEVLRIEQESFDSAWSEEDFLCCLRERNCIGMVVECNQQIVGFVIYELKGTALRILTIAVAVDWRRQGVGTAIVQKLIYKLCHQRRNRIEVFARETNLKAHLFLQRFGFVATEVLHGFYHESAEDAYFFEYRLGRPSTRCVETA